jgi:uncharacterized protein
VPLTFRADTVLLVPPELGAVVVGELLFELPQALSASAAPTRSAISAFIPRGTGVGDGWISGRATLVRMTSFSLRQVKLRPGEQYRDELEVQLSPLSYGGQRYLPVPDTVPAEFEITRANTGTVFTLGFTVRLHGPCYRCLGDAVLELPIHAREYQDEKPEDEQMATEYVTGNMLDVSAWARDAIALALPDKILCRPDCAGLCGECGKNLNEEPHTHEEQHADPRWAALEALREKI